MLGYVGKYSNSTVTRLTLLVNCLYVELLHPTGRVKLPHPIGCVKLSQLTGCVKLPHPTGCVKLPHPTGWMKLPCILCMWAVTTGAVTPPW